MCQRPKRALFISTVEFEITVPKLLFCVNALNGLSSFLQKSLTKIQKKQRNGVNALNGLSSFLRYPLKPRINTGFPASFLQVFA